MLRLYVEVSRKNDAGGGSVCLYENGETGALDEDVSLPNAKKNNNDIPKIENHLRFPSMDTILSLL